MDINIRCRDYSGSGDLVMNKKVEISYTFMVGNLYVKSVTHSGVELSDYDKNVIRVHDESEMLKSRHYVAHVKRIQDYLKRLKEHGITDVKVIETKVVTETTNREVELKPVHAESELGLFPVKIMFGDGSGTIFTDTLSCGIKVGTISTKDLWVDKNEQV